jgi:hypothetical protein
VSIARPIALLLGLTALALCLFVLLIRPHAVSLLLVVGYAASIYAMIDRQPRWIAIVSAIFCILMSAVCGVVGFEVWITGDWYGTATSRIQFLAALLLLGTAGPLLSLYVMFGMYARSGSTDTQSIGL